MDDKRDRIEDAKFIVGRLDSFFEGVNTKGNLYLVINTFLIGGILTSYSFLNGVFPFPRFCNALLVLMLLFCFLSIQCTMAAINPYTNRGNSLHKNSTIFFGDIARFEVADFQQEFTNKSDSDLLDDITRQISIMSKGLANKYVWLGRAGLTLYVSFALLFFIVFITLTIFLNAK